LNFTEDLGRFISISLGVNISAITTEAKELEEFAIVSGNERFFADNFLNFNSMKLNLVV
jgi:hypothetical protein